MFGWFISLIPGVNRAFHFFFTCTLEWILLTKFCRATVKVAPPLLYTLYIIVRNCCLHISCTFCFSKHCCIGVVLFCCIAHKINNKCGITDILGFAIKIHTPIEAYLISHLNIFQIKRETTECLQLPDCEPKLLLERCSWHSSLIPIQLSLKMSFLSELLY